MAFTRNTLQCVQAKSGVVGMSEWIYDTLDAVGTIDGTDYFAGVAAGATDPLGIHVGDRITARIWDTAVPATTVAKDAATISDAAVFMVIGVDSDGNATVSAETAIVVAAGS